jgi:mannose-6-phosphate isomerase
MKKILPFKLMPQFREYVWGGTRLRPAAERTAEAWVVYEQNLIADGPLAGMTLAQAAQELGEQLLGSAAIARTGMKFPLLIKLLDCAQWLSLQVHPNNEQALRWEGAGHFGKMEGWYVIDADPGAQLISGFRPGSTRDMIRSSVGTKGLLDIVGWKDVSGGDSLLIEPGTLHALGPGLLIYEVQQTSDLTYRVYDWDRPMDSGRKLHLEQAADVLNPATDGKMAHTERDFCGEKELFSCPFFSLDLFKNLTDKHVQETCGTSFHAITFVEGSGQVFGADWQHALQCFETILIPASCGQYQIDQKNGACLVAYVPA